MSTLEIATRLITIITISGSAGFVLRGLLDKNPDLRDCDASRSLRLLNPATEAKIKAALRMVVAVKHCMMFRQIHDEQSMVEILKKYRAPSVDLLAKRATETAEELLNELEPGWKHD